MNAPTSSRADFAGPFRLEADCDLAAFGAALRDAGFDTQAMNAVREGIVVRSRLDAAVLDLRTEEPTSFNTLFRLFLLGYALPASAIETALGGFAVEPLTAAGVLRAEGEQLRANARIDLWEDRFVFADFAREGVAMAEHVLGTAEASSCLSALTVRRPARSALDVGTGGGCQSLLLSAHCEKVVGTDVSLRALNFASANARLNGVENLKLRQGSFFEPVDGETFDLVVSNPPFIISPESRFVFRDSGLPGDAVSQHVVEQAAAHLDEGGFATMLVNWHHRTAQDWGERPSEWVRDNGCDVFWMRCDTHDPVNYALTWMRNGNQADSPDTGEMLKRWLKCYESLGAGMISFGVVILRKRSGGKNWKRFDFLDRSTALGRASDQIQRIFESEDILRNLPDAESLLDRKYRVAAAHEVEERRTLKDGTWRSSPLLLRLAEGIEYSAAIDEHVLKLLEGLESRKTLREVAADVASEMHAPPDAVVPVALTITRALMQKGLLAPG